MKECTYCGKRYPDEAVVCAVDGQPLRNVIAASPALTPAFACERQQIVDEEHLKLLSIFHFVVAGLALLGIGLLILHFCFMSTVFSSPDLWKSQKNGPPPKELFKAFIWLYAFLGCVIGGACLLNLLSGLFLQQRRHRTFSIVVAALNCLQVPFGTVLGVFTLVVLLRDSVRQRYAPLGAVTQK
jgi:hypothetical protein